MKWLGPDFRWIEVATAVAASVIFSLAAAVAYREGVKAEALLGLAGTIFGAAVGAWLAVVGALSVAKRNAAREADEIRGLLIRALGRFKPAFEELSAASWHGGNLAFIPYARARGVLRDASRILAKVQGLGTVKDFDVIVALDELEVWLAYYAGEFDDALGMKDRVIEDPDPPRLDELGQSLLQVLAPIARRAQRTLMQLPPDDVPEGPRA